MNKTALLFLSLLFFITGCGSGSGDTVGSSGQLPDDAVSGQTTRELLLNGVYMVGGAFEDNVDTIWICSDNNATRGFGLVFLDDESGRDVGIYYLGSGDSNLAFFWRVEDSGDVSMSVTGTSARGNQIIAPEFSSVNTFTSSGFRMFGGELTPTTCIRERFVYPVNF